MFCINFTNAFRIRLLIDSEKSTSVQLYFFRIVKYFGNEALEDNTDNNDFKFLVTVVTTLSSEAILFRYKIHKSWCLTKNFKMHNSRFTEQKYLFNLAISKIKQSE